MIFVPDVLRNPSGLLLQVWSTVSVTVERYLTVVHPLTRYLVQCILFLQYPFPHHDYRPHCGIFMMPTTRYSQMKSMVYILPVVLLTLVCVILFFFTHDKILKHSQYWSGTFRASGSWTRASSPRMSPSLATPQITQLRRLR